MKEKVLVRVGVPMADIAFDMRIPYDLSAATTAGMAADMLNSLAGRRLPLNPVPVLWYGKTGKVLEDAKTIREYEITDSDILLLI